MKIVNFEEYIHLKPILTNVDTWKGFVRLKRDHYFVITYVDDFNLFSIFLRIIFIKDPRVLKESRQH